MFPVFSGGWQWPLMLVAYLLNSFSEEGAIRVIAVTRLQAIAKSPIAAILVANFLFASYHLYQGWLSAIGVFVFGIFLSLVFSWTKSIWPIVLGHTLSNVVITAIS